MPRFAVLFALLFFALPVFAQDVADDDSYTVTGIAVDSSGKNGNEARDKAFTDGGRLALAAIASKLTGAKNPDFKAVDNNTIGGLVKSFEVESEKASGKRYIATLTYHFKPSRTDAFLSARGMSVRDSSEITAAPATPSMRVVVLPIVRTGDRSVLWEEKTDWAKAFENYTSDHADANVIVPAGEMDDISTISAGEALGGVHDPLMKVMQRYEAQSVLVAVLSAPSITPTPDRDLNVQLAVFDRNAVMKSTSSFNLAATPREKAMEWLQGGAASALTKWQSVSDKLVATATKPSNPNVATVNGMLQMAINVPFATPDQWQTMRARLQEINGLTRFDVVSLTHARATVLVTYQGSRPMFEGALAEKGLRLQQTEPTGPLTLLVTGAQGAPSTMRPASTFQTVYPPPPVPKDEVIYADPPEDKDSDASNDESSDQDDSGRAPPPPVAKKAPPQPAQEMPPLIP